MVQKWNKTWLVILLILLFSGVAFAGLQDRSSKIELMRDNYIMGPEIASPATPASGWWKLYGKTDGKLYFINDAGTSTELTATTTTAFDDIAAPDAAKTLAFTTFESLLTGTKTDGDQWTFRGLGAFGDVSVVKIESHTGNPTDGTVLEVVAHDANVDPLVVSTSAQAGAFVVGQTGIVTSVGQLVATGGVSPGSAADSIMKVDTVELINAQIKALRGSPKELIATPGAGKYIEIIRVDLILDYGSEALTESADNLVVQYATSNVAATATIESTGFIDATADTVYTVLGSAMTGVAAANMVNNAIELINSGDGEFGGNASADTTMTVKITYIIHTAGL
jgi:hypothetical protein